jgi:hypothetical protein
MGGSVPNLSGKSAGATPVIVQDAVCRLFGVHHYDDVFERIVHSGLLPASVGRGLGRRIDPAVRASSTLFIHIPKNAGTSIATAIYGHSPGHKTALFYSVAAGGLAGWEHTFAVLRDPVERFLSAYWFIQRNGTAEIAIQPGFARKLSGITTVDQMLDVVELNQRNLYNLDHVLRPQWWYISDLAGKIIVPTLYVVGEDLQALELSLYKSGVSGVPFRNRTEKGALTLTAAQVGRIQTLYERDVRLFRRVTAASGCE